MITILNSDMIQSLKEQLKYWTIVGPMPLLPSVDKWLLLKIDGAKTVPESFYYACSDVAICKVKIEKEILDLTYMIYINISEGQQQMIAFCSITVPNDGTISMTYDADWSAVLWGDGNEVYATRQGNGGTVGDMKHEIIAGLKKGNIF